MKAASMFFKILNCVAAIVTLTLFFFSFVSVVTPDGAFTLTGFQLAFGSEQTLNGEQISLWKSAWYMFAFILSALSLLFSALSFKIRGARYASLVASLATAINLTVLFCAGSVTQFVDTRPLETVTSVSKELFFLPALLVAVGAFVLSVISLLVSDYAEVLESNGAKLPILRRILNFFKDYKSEITKIVWPSRKTVIRNTVVVLIMCAVVGIYIWLLDLGLAKLLGLILGIEGM